MSDTIDGLKQRLVGAFVILSLAIIFLPMIFDKPHTVGTTSVVPVPPKPEFKSVVIKKPEKPVFKELSVDESDKKLKVTEVINRPAIESSDNEVDEKKSSEDKNKNVVASNSAGSNANSNQSSDAKKVVPAKSSKANTTQSTSKPQSQSRPRVSNLDVFKNTWMVQLGTFSNTKNAYRLRDRLRRDGFDGHTKNIKIKGKNAVRVFTGPFATKTTAEKTKKKLDAKYKVKSIVLYFDA